MDKKQLNVVEIFTSLQGEGGNMGMKAHFIRLAKCNLDCWFCDTEFEKGVKMTLESISEQLQEYAPCHNIIWTGGEPTLQLTEDIVQYFKRLGYYQAIETNGTKLPPLSLDYVSLSPKIDASKVKAIYGERLVDEIRIPIKKGDLLPSIEELPKARRYFISPIFEGEPNEKMEYMPEYVSYCIDLIHNNPIWRLSVQMHKLLSFK